jgi:hypothetical protein
MIAASATMKFLDVDPFTTPPAILARQTPREHATPDYLARAVGAVKLECGNFSRDFPRNAGRDGFVPGINYHSRS